MDTEAVCRVVNGAEQFEHDEDAQESEKEPCGQLEQTVAPADENMPGPQGRQESVPPGADQYPELHMHNAIEVLARFELENTGQALHVTAFELLLCGLTSVPNAS